MVNKSEFLDYSICGQLVLSILFFILFQNKFKGVIVYFSLVIFISYWLIKVVFKKDTKIN